MPASQMPQNEFPMPANLRPSAPPAAPTTPASAPAVLAPTMAAFLFGQGRESFRLDPDLRMALTDMQQASGEDWQGFLERAVGEALRFWMGR